MGKCFFALTICFYVFTGTLISYLFVSGLIDLSKDHPNSQFRISEEIKKIVKKYLQKNGKISIKSIQKEIEFEIFDSLFGFNISLPTNTCLLKENLQIYDSIWKFPSHSSSELPCFAAWIEKEVWKSFKGSRFQWDKENITWKGIGKVKFENEEPKISKFLSKFIIIK